jgi:glutaredoxin
MKEPLRLYGTASCPQCQGAKKYLEQKQVPFEYIDVFESTEGMKELENRGLTTLPVVMLNDGTSYVTGFNAKAINNLIKEEM